jgi:hypothetical protein
MSASTRTCELCDDTGYTGESLFLLLGILLGLTLFFAILLKTWKVNQ